MRRHSDGAAWAIGVVAIPALCVGLGLVASVAGTKTETRTVTERIPYETTYVEDATVDYGKSVVRVHGVYGQRETSYKVTVNGGREVSRVKIGSKVTKEPVTEVVAKGTKPAWHCWDTTSFDRNPYNDNYCEYSDGSGRYVPDSEAKALDPSYNPGKSGAPYYNNF